MAAALSSLVVALPAYLPSDRRGPLARTVQIVQPATLTFIASVNITWNIRSQPAAVPR